jgi:hypothetical protein
VTRSKCNKVSLLCLRNCLLLPDWRMAIWYFVNVKCLCDKEITNASRQTAFFGAAESETESLLWLNALLIRLWVQQYPKWFLFRWPHNPLTTHKSRYLKMSMSLMLFLLLRLVSSLRLRVKSKKFCSRRAWFMSIDEKKHENFRQFDVADEDYCLIA